MIGPYQARPYDGSQGARRLSDLALDAGDVRAQGSLRRGAAWGGALRDVGQIAQRTMADLAEYEESKPIREAEQAKARSYTAQTKRAEAYQQALKEAGQYDPDDAIDFLRSKGFAEEASKMQKELEQARRDGIETTLKKFELAGKSLEQAALLMGTVKEAGPNAPAAYAATRDKIAALVGPELAQTLPPEYDPAFVDKAMQWGMSMKDKLDLQSKELANANMTGKSLQERDAYFTGSLAKLLPMADSPEEWAEVIESARGLGAPAETIAKFGETFSPEAVERARAIGAPVDKTPPGEGSFDAFIVAYANEKGTTPDKLSSADRVKARRTWESAGWKPETPKSTAGSDVSVTPAAYGTAERWKQESLAALEKDFRPAYKEMQQAGDTDGAARLLEEHERRKKDVIESFLTQVGAKNRGSRGASLADLAAPPAAASATAPNATSAPPAGPRVNFRRPAAPATSSEKPDPVRLRLPGGRVKTFPSQEAAEGFMKAAGYTAK